MPLDSCLDLPAFMLSTEGRVLWWNDACAAFTGLSEQRMKQAQAWEAFYKQPKQLPADVLLDAQRSGKLPASPSGLPDDTAFRSHIIFVEKPMCCTLWTWSRLSFDSNDKVDGVIQLFAPASLEQAVENSPLVRLIIDRFPLPVALLKNRRFCMVNKAYTDLVKYDDPSELRGKPGDFFIDEKDKPQFNRLNSNNHQQIISGNTYRWRYRTKTGELRHIIGHPSVLSWEDGALLLSTLTDDTENVLRQQSILAEQKALKKKINSLLQQISQKDDLFFGESPIIQALMQRVVTSAKSDSNIVITGETGTGKSLLARLIHNLSPRRDKPFISVNCGAIPENLMENEFFGHVKGAFTGAISNSQGFFGAADGGTLFLDEVGELSLAMQVKLLQAIESRAYSPIGSNKMHYSDVRLICATNRDLKRMMQEGSLRRDFFFRIFVVDLHVPPLRERKEDIALFAKFLFRKFNTLDTDPVIPPDVLEKLRRYDWPGNIREMQNVILRYLATGSLRFLQIQSETNEDTNPNDLDMEKALERTRRCYVVRALQRTGGNKKEAAALLGMPLRTFQRYCSQMGIVRRLPDLEAFGSQPPDGGNGMSPGQEGS